MAEPQVILIFPETRTLSQLVFIEFPSFSWKNYPFSSKEQLKVPGPNAEFPDGKYPVKLPRRGPTAGPPNRGRLLAEIFPGKCPVGPFGLAGRSFSFPLSSDLQRAFSSDFFRRFPAGASENLFFPKAFAGGYRRRSGPGWDPAAAAGSAAATALLVDLSGIIFLATLTAGAGAANGDFRWETPRPVFFQSGYGLSGGILTLF